MLLLLSGQLEQSQGASATDLEGKLSPYYPSWLTVTPAPLASMPVQARLVRTSRCVALVSASPVISTPVLACNPFQPSLSPSCDSLPGHVNATPASAVPAVPQLPAPPAGISMPTPASAIQARVIREGAELIIITLEGNPQSYCCC